MADWAVNTASEVRVNAYSMATMTPPGPSHQENLTMNSTATAGQLSGDLRSAISQLDQLVTHLDRFHTDVRAMGDAVLKHFDAIKAAAEAAGEFSPLLRPDMNKHLRGMQKDLSDEFATLRVEAGTRYELLGMRFDTIEAAVARIERDVGTMRVDVLRLADGQVNAQHSALQANLRRADTGNPPPQSAKAVHVGADFVTASRL
jgi:hypothetical protein